MSDVRVLVVDDSPTVRAVIRRILVAEGIQVVGEAADGDMAVRGTLELAPDVVVMDVEMPRMDGYSAIVEIMSRRPTPIVVLSSRARRDHVLCAFEAMQRGAVAVLAKPAVPSEWDTLALDLVETLRHLGGEPTPPVSRPLQSRVEGHLVKGRVIRYVAVGASTGGPAALRQLLAGLGGDSGAGVAVVQHIAPTFEAGLAEWLESELDLDVGVARDGEELRAGVVRIAPDGGHLVVSAGGILKIDRQTPPRRGHRPSVDELFLSLTRVYPRHVAAVLLTGMGQDGVEGMLALRRGGALTVVQDQASCAVFGMPRAALEAGAANLALPPLEIGRLIARVVRGEDSA